MIIRVFSLLFFTLTLSACGGGSGSGGDSSEKNSEDTSFVINDIEYPDVCKQQELPEPLPSSEFEIENLHAVYFSEEDENPDSWLAEGTNGSDPSILRTYITEFDIEDTRLDILRSEFEGVPAEKLNVKWQGDINVTSDSAVIYADFDLSHADLSFSIDGEVVQRMKDCNPTVPLILGKGIHHFEVDYHSHYFSATLDLNFSSERPMPLSSLSSYATENFSGNEKILYIKIHESDTEYADTQVDLPSDAGDLIVILDSYRGIDWTINEADGTNLVAVFYSSYQNTARVTAPAEATAIEGLWSQGEPIGDFVRANFGRTLDYYYYQYHAEQISISLTTDIPDPETLYGEPVLVLDNIQYAQWQVSYAKSISDGQEVAQYFELEYGAILTEIAWTGVSLWEPSMYFPTISDQGFTINIYNGVLVPDELVFTTDVTVSPSEYFSLEQGTVYNLESPLETQLDPGSYWLSIQNKRNSDQAVSFVILENDGVNNGGAARGSSTASWGTTEEGVLPPYATGISVNIKGYVTD